jgi:hypothetical protein
VTPHDLDDLRIRLVGVACPVHLSAARVHAASNCVR